MNRYDLHLAQCLIDRCIARTAAQNLGKRCRRRDDRCVSRMSFLGARERAEIALRQLYETLSVKN